LDAPYGFDPVLGQFLVDVTNFLADQHLRFELCGRASRDGEKLQGFTVGNARRAFSDVAWNGKRTAR